ncbi:hypothetical protein BC941DRAFT_463825 [Chlamydoabsidia padenii]|nr:hypothetical protein BC941DRAFT_463825 [Chlamydoabsidia padenii]
MPDDLDMSSLLDPSLWSFDSTQQPSSPLQQQLCKDTQFQTPMAPTPTDPWFPTPSYSVPSTEPPSPQQPLLPPTPPVDSQPMFYGHLQAPNMMPSFVPPHQLQQQAQRRRSEQLPYRKNSATPRRRASSVASVVSLTAHEPIAHLVDGIEHITFLYSHDRLIKEYTVRTDVNNLDLDDVPMDFRLQNAIYPRANVEREEYDGNRWNYETSCNELGWKLCWLNRDQLFGKRGLIQRAVDSYRNRHADLRSRRVTRQEKLANGTLRIRRAKKLNRPL